MDHSLDEKYKDLFDYFINPAIKDKVCLVAGEFENRAVAILCFKQSEESIVPVALLDGKKLFERIKTREVSDVG